MSSTNTSKQFLSAQEQTSSGALGNELSGAAPPRGGRTVWFHRTGEEFARNKELIANLLPRTPPQMRWYCVAASKVKCFLSQVMAACALPGSLHLAASAAGAVPNPAERQGKGGGLSKPFSGPCQSATERQVCKRCLQLGLPATCALCYASKWWSLAEGKSDSMGLNSPQRCRARCLTPGGWPDGWRLPRAEPTILQDQSHSPARHRVTWLTLDHQSL